MSKFTAQKSNYICVKCGYKLALSETQKQKLKYSSPTLWCQKCKEFTVHKKDSFYAKERDALLFKEIFCNNIANLNNVVIKCEMKNGLFFLSQTVDEVAEFILQNNLTKDARDYILNEIHNVLNSKAESVYGLKFRYIYQVLYDNYCYEPIGYCKLKGCYLSETDELEKNCRAKKCINYLEKK